MSVRPIFIFSPPRSGSTLLQRALAAHSRVATTSEPWMLLPLLAPLYDHLPASGQRDELIHTALEDFIAELPGQTGEYRAAVREFALTLYGRLTPSPADHFVDKTPLYHLIVDEIVETFPDGLFIFLFRNPLSVLASSLELFDDGRWEAARYHMALFQSYASLIPAYERHRGRCLGVRYEDLASGREDVWRSIFDHLDLSWEPEILSGFSSVELHGRMGDQTGIHAYSSLSTSSVDKWRVTVSNPLRRMWCERYLRWLGHDRLRVMGYDLDGLRAELSSTGRSGDHLRDDAIAIGSSFIREVARTRLPLATSRASTWRALLKRRN